MYKKRNVMVNWGWVDQWIRFSPVLWNFGLQLLSTPLDPNFSSIFLLQVIEYNTVLQFSRLITETEVGNGSPFNVANKYEAKKSGESV